MREPTLIADRDNDNATLVAWDGGGGRILIRPEPRLGIAAADVLEGKPA